MISTARADRSEAITHKQRGDQLRAERKRTEAVSAYRAAIAADPQYAPAVDALASHFLVQGEYAAAEKLLSAALERLPRHATGWSTLAYALRRQGKHDAAIAAYRRSTELDPKVADPHYGIGLALHASGSYAAAARSFRRYVVLEGDPSRDRWVRKARALAEESELRALDQNGDARARAVAGRAADGGDARAESMGLAAQLARMEARRQQEQRRRAHGGAASGAVLVPRPVSPPERIAETSVAGGPAWARVRAQRLALDGGYQEAMALYEEAVVADPFDLAAYDGLAHAAYSAGQMQSGIAAMRTALRDNRGYHRGWLHLARLHAGDESWVGSVGSYRRYLRSVPLHHAVRLELAGALERAGREAEAVRECQRYLAAERRTASPQQLRAVLREFERLTKR